MMIVLLFVVVMIPIRIAFTNTSEVEETKWLVTYGVIDGFFLIDIILTFFTSYTDEAESLDI